MRTSKPNSKVSFEKQGKQQLPRIRLFENCYQGMPEASEENPERSLTLIIQRAEAERKTHLKKNWREGKCFNVKAYTERGSRKPLLEGARGRRSGGESGRVACIRQF